MQVVGDAPSATNQRRAGRIACHQQKQALGRDTLDRPDLIDLSDLSDLIDPTNPFYNSLPCPTPPTNASS
jgi:hypothetical protein